METVKFKNGCFCFLMTIGIIAYDKNDNRPLIAGFGFF